MFGGRVCQRRVVASEVKCESQTAGLVPEKTPQHTMWYNMPPQDSRVARSTAGPRRDSHLIPRCSTGAPRRRSFCRPRWPKSGRHLAKFRSRDVGSDLGPQESRAPVRRFRSRRDLSGTGVFLGSAREHVSPPAGGHRYMMGCRVSAHMLRGYTRCMTCQACNTARHL